MWNVRPPWPYSFSLGFILRGIIFYSGWTVGAIKLTRAWPPPTTTFHSTFFTLLLAAMKGSELFCVQNKFGGLPYTHNMKSWWWSWYVLWRFAICHTSQGRLSHDQLNITLEAKKCETEPISFLYCPKVSRKKQSWPILSWWRSWHKLTSPDSYIWE